MSLARLRHLAPRATLVLAAAMVLLQLAGPAVRMNLRYDRDAVLDGEAWRLVTAHLVHFDLAHLTWNLLGLALVAWLFARDFNLRGWLLILAASTAAIDAGFLVFMPELSWYVGFSGVLHGAMAAGLLAWLAHSRDWVTWLVSTLFGAKLLWEHFAGPLPFTASTLALPVVHEAHSFGALGGLAAAGWLQWRRQARMPSL